MGNMSKWCSWVYGNLPFAALLRKGVFLEKATLEGVRIHVAVDEEGHSNLPKRDEEEQNPVAAFPILRRVDID